MLPRLGLARHCRGCPRCQIKPPANIAASAAFPHPGCKPPATGRDSPVVEHASPCLESAPDIGKAAGQPETDSRQSRETRSRRPMTGGQASARRYSPITPTPRQAIVRAIAQPSNVVPGKTGRKIARDRPRSQGCPDSNARHIPGTAPNPGNLFFQKFPYQRYLLRSPLDSKASQT